MKDLRVVFMGTPDFAVPILESLVENTNVVLVVTKTDSLVGRKKELKESSVAIAAHNHNIPVMKPISLKKEYESILNYKPDIIITCAYGKIVPKVILDYPEYGCINVHASLLPKYRGANPIQQAIYNGETETGITIMYMDEGIDTGNIIHAKSLEILDDDNIETLSNKLSVLGSELLIKVLPKIIEGENFDIPQNNDEATYVSYLTREMETIDFKRTAKDVYNHVRSLNPYPLANTTIDGVEWKIIECSISDIKSTVPGEISSVGKDYIGISCSDYEIHVKRVKITGKKEMLVKDLFNGMKKESLLKKVVGE